MHSLDENYAALKRGLMKLLPLSSQNLRLAQKKVLTDFLFSPEEMSRGIFELATAFGKTRIMKMLIMGYLQSSPNGQVVVLVPSQELVSQTLEKMKEFHEIFSDIGLFYAKRKDKKNTIIVSTYASLGKLQKEIDVSQVGLLLLDEAHHAISQKRAEIIRLFKNACWYGMTATPYYNEDNNLSNLLGKTIVRVDVPQSVKDGSLTPFKNILLVSKTSVDLSGVFKNNSGDYDIADYYRALRHAFSGSVMVDESDWRIIHEKIATQVAQFYHDFVDYEDSERACDRKCLINCRTQEEAHIQARVLNNLFGRMVAASWTSDSPNRSVLNAFENGQLSVLCQVGKLEEGYDCPPVSLCINYPTSSRVRSAQRGGRVLRLDPDNPFKNAWIVDIVFSHPEVAHTSALVSAHKNNQILYADIVRTTAVKRENTQILPPINKMREGLNRVPSNVFLQDFDIVSDTEVLMKMENELRVFEQNQEVCPKTDNMLRAVELACRLHKSIEKEILICFQHAYQNQETICVNGKEVPLVVYARSGSNDCYCLRDNSESTIQAFLNRYGKRLDYRKIYDKTDEMITHVELSTRFNIKKQKLLYQCFKNAYESNMTVSINGKEQPLVVQATCSGRGKLYLYDSSKEAIDAFLSVFNDVIWPIQPKSKKMLGVLEMALRLGIDKRKEIRGCFQDAYQQKKMVWLQGRETPLVALVKSGHKTCLCLADDSPEMVESFIALYGKKIGYERLERKTQEMLTLEQLTRLFRKTTQRKFFVQFLQEAYQNNLQVVLNGKEVPLILRVKSVNRVCFCLRDNRPETVSAFKKAYDAYMITQSKEMTLNKESLIRTKKRDEGNSI